MSLAGWIGIDLDGTLAHYDGWKGANVIGDPIPEVLARAKTVQAAGRKIKIFTARACEKEKIPYIDRKSTRLNSSHVSESRMPSSA